MLMEPLSYACHYSMFCGIMVKQDIKPSFPSNSSYFDCEDRSYIKKHNNIRDKCSAETKLHKGLSRESRGMRHMPSYLGVFGKASSLRMWHLIRDLEDAKVDSYVHIWRKNNSCSGSSVIVLIRQK